MRIRGTESPLLWVGIDSLCRYPSGKRTGNAGFLTSQYRRRCALSQAMGTVRPRRRAFERGDRNRRPRAGRVHTCQLFHTFWARTALNARKKLTICDTARLGPRTAVTTKDSRDGTGVGVRGVRLRAVKTNWDVAGRRA